MSHGIATTTMGNLPGTNPPPPQDYLHSGNFAQEIRDRIYDYLIPDEKSLFVPQKSKYLIASHAPIFSVSRRIRKEYHDRLMSAGTPKPRHVYARVLDFNFRKLLAYMMRQRPQDLTQFDNVSSLLYVYLRFENVGLDMELFGKWIGFVHRMEDAGFPFQVGYTVEYVAPAGREEVMTRLGEMGTVLGAEKLEIETIRAEVKEYWDRLANGEEEEMEVEDEDEDEDGGDAEIEDEEMESEESEEMEEGEMEGSETEGEEREVKDRDDLGEYSFVSSSYMKAAIGNEDEGMEDAD